MRSIDVEMVMAAKELDDKKKLIDRVLEIIDEDVGEHIYRDAFKSREDLTKLYDRVRSHVVALKGGEQG